MITNNTDSFPSYQERKRALQEVAAYAINKKVYAAVGVNKTVLSVGCNRGILEALLRKKGNRVFGIDINAQAIDAARQILDGAFVVNAATAKKLPFSKQFFDVIIFADIIEHLVDPSVALRLVQPYLKNNGYIILSLPNVANWAVRLPLLFGNFKYTDGGLLDKTHLHFFTLSSSRRILHATGYSIIATEYNTSILNALYSYFKKSTSADTPSEMPCISPTQQETRVKNKSYIKRKIRGILEAIDEALTFIFPGFFTYQFIFVARLKR